MTFVPVAVSENQRGELRLTEYARQLTTGGGKPGQGYPAVMVPFVKVVRSGARDADGNLPPEVWAERDTAPTLNAMDNTGDTRATVLAVQKVDMAAEHWRVGDTASPLTAGMSHGSTADLNAILTESWTGGAQQDQFVALHDVAPTLTHSSNHNLGHHEPKVLVPVTYPLAMRGRDGGAELEMGEPNTYNALRAGNGGSSLGGKVLTPDLAVRRLTPVECERLMGWPDGHAIGADSHRYKQCGNGVVAPVAEWIGRRLMEAAT
jgi:site-specific DNA-cytosine methylase